MRIPAAAVAVVTGGRGAAGSAASLIVVVDPAADVLGLGAREGVSPGNGLSPWKPVRRQSFHFSPKPAAAIQVWRFVFTPAVLSVWKLFQGRSPSHGEGAAHGAEGRNADNASLPSCVPSAWASGRPGFGVQKRSHPGYLCGPLEGLGQADRWSTVSAGNRTGIAPRNSSFLRP